MRTIAEAVLPMTSPSTSSPAEALISSRGVYSELDLSLDRRSMAEEELRKPRPQTGIVELSEASRRMDYDEIYKSCVRARDELIETSNKLRVKLGESRLDPDAQHSWTEVDEAVQSACRDMEKQVTQSKLTQGAPGRLRRAFRALCRHAGIAETAISLIPADAFGFSSSLCAGFKVIFSAMRQATLYREEVVKALEELPYILKDSAELSSTIIFKDDEDLHQRRASLYTAVFKALKHILLWFLKSSLVTTMKLLVDPTGFAERLNEHINSVKLKAQLFQNQALKLSMLLQAHSIRLQHANNLELQAIQSRTEHIEAETVQIKVATFDMLERLDSRLHQDSVDISPAQKPRKSRRRLAEPRSQRGERSQQTSVVAAAADILAEFCYDDGMAASDCDQITKLSSRPSWRSNDDELDGDRVLWMQSHWRLRAWLALDQSSMLLLHGRSLPRPQSEVSFVTAKLARCLLDIHQSQDSKPGYPYLIPLLFFCGQHRDWQRDPNANAAELAMSLALQLLDRGTSHFSPEALQRFRAKTIPNDTVSICSSLHDLITQLRRNIFVVIIIDGLGFFARPAERQDQTREVISRLVAIFKTKPRATLKFLFTSPTRCDFVEDLFTEDQVLHISRYMPSSGSNDDTTWMKPIDVKLLS